VYTHFFKLREPPFSITPDPTYLYLSPRHQEALGHLLYGTGQHGGFVQLTGEVGTGKTTIVRTLLAQKLENVDVAVILNPRQSEQEFVQSICDELHVPYPRPSTELGTGSGLTLKVLHDALNAHLIAAHAAGRRTVVIIDEAQNLERNVLEQVRLLTNLETHKDKLLRIMLVGQPELAEMLSRADLRQLSTRVTARYHLTPLSPQETAEYVQHRLRVAGSTEPIFSPRSLALIHKLTGGVPRLVNILCDRSMLGAYARNEHFVLPQTVEGASAEALGEPQERRRNRLGFLTDRRRWSATDKVLVTLIIGVCGWWWFGRPEPFTPPERDSAAAVAATPAPAALEPQPEPRAAEPRLRDVLENSEPLAIVMSHLIQLWSPGAKLEPGEQICPGLARQGLQCYRAQGDWKDVEALNRPAILTLATGRGITKYVLLRELAGDTLVLDTVSGPLRLPREEIATAWTGEFLVLWRPPTAVLTIAAGMRGPAVVWLRERLAQASGQSLQQPASELFDNALREQVLRFQRERSIKSDGVVGARTQMLLSALSSDPAEPRLAAAGRS
jgi:general secretion pathway protein A